MRVRSLLIVVAVATLIPVPLSAQRAGGAGRGGAPATPRAAAPFDLTGVWVSVVTEDWRWRMIVPKKGDYSGVPLTAEGKKLADTWEPAKMAADGCKPFGAPAIMRVPGRLRIAWENDTTLKIETDAGQQTRLLRFEKDEKLAKAPRSWQGYSAAEWDRIISPGGQGVSLQRAAPRVGSLKVVTSNVRAGYLRTNGVPYSENVAMTEYFDRLSAFGTEWMTVLTILDDPQYLDQPFITSTHFKKEPDASTWMPSPCE